MEALKYNHVPDRRRGTGQIKQIPAFRQDYAETGSRSYYLYPIFGTNKHSSHLTPANFVTHYQVLLIKTQAYPLVITSMNFGNRHLLTLGISAVLDNIVQQVFRKAA